MSWKRAKKVRVDADKGLYKKSHTTPMDQEYLDYHDYKEISMCGILSTKKQKYFIRPRYNESFQHFFLVFEIADYLRKFTRKVCLYETVRPDIVFKIKGKEYAVEVETGKTLTNNKRRLLEKVKNLNKIYEDRWFFVVTNRVFTSRYKKFGKTFDKRNVAKKILDVIRCN